MLNIIAKFNIIPEGFLTPDEETKGIVQRIYREYLSGKGYAELAREAPSVKIAAPRRAFSSPSSPVLPEKCLFL